MQAKWASVEREVGKEKLPRGEKGQQPLEAEAETIMWGSMHVKGKGVFGNGESDDCNWNSGRTTRGLGALASLHTSLASRSTK